MGGLDISRRYQVYKAIIWPVLSYGLTLWFKLGGKGVQHLIRRLSVAQNVGLRWITGAFRTTPIRTLEFYSGIPPVDLFAELCFKKWALRITKLHESHPSRELCSHARITFHESVPARPTPGPKGITHNVFSQFRSLWRASDEIFLPFNDKNIPGSSVLEVFSSRIEFFNKNHPRKSDSHDFQLWLRNFSVWLDSMRQSSVTIIATDGSLKKNKGTSGFSVWRDNFMTHTETWSVSVTSSFAAELQALQGAFAYLSQSHSSGRVLFLVDNVTAMLQIFDASVHQSQDCSIHAMKMLFSWFTEGGADNRLLMSWCPSHSGILENETIDRLVGLRGANSLEQISTSYVPLATAQSHFLNELLSKWSDRLREQTSNNSPWLRPRGSKGRMVKPTMGKTTKKRWLLADNNVELFSRVVRFQTGHMPSGEYNNRIRRKTYDFCSFCAGAPHSRRHIFNECSKYKRTQGSTISSLLRARSTFAKTVKFFKENPSAGTFGDCPSKDAV